MINTPIFLQKALKKFLQKEIHNNYENSKNKKQKINVYRQNLPAKSTNSEIYPFINIKILNGSYKEQKEEVKIGLLVGVYDDNEEFKGTDTLLNLIEKIKQVLLNKKTFGAYQLENLEWDIPEEDIYPFFIGGIELTFSLNLETLDSQENI